MCISANSLCHLMKGETSHQWTMSSLVRRYSTIPFQCKKQQYHQACTAPSHHPQNNPSRNSSTGRSLGQHPGPCGNRKSGSRRRTSALFKAKAQVGWRDAHSRSNLGSNHNNHHRLCHTKLSLMSSIYCSCNSCCSW